MLSPEQFCQISNKHGLLKKRIHKEIVTFGEDLKKRDPNAVSYDHLVDPLDDDIIYRYSVSIKGKKYKVKLLLSQDYPFKSPLEYRITDGELELNLPDSYYDRTYLSQELQEFYEKKTNDYMIKKTVLCPEIWLAAMSLFLPFIEFLDYFENINKIIPKYFFVKKLFKDTETISNNHVNQFLLNEELTEYVSQWL